MALTKFTTVDHGRTTMIRTTMVVNHSAIQQNMVNVCDLTWWLNGSMVLTMVRFHVREIAGTFSSAHVPYSAEKRASLNKRAPNVLDSATITQELLTQS